MSILYKHPTASRVYTFSFETKLAQTESVTSLESLSVVAKGDVVEVAPIVVGTPVAYRREVLVRLSDGTDQETYNVTCVVNTDAGNRLVRTGCLKVVTEACV